jgi:hypothetical protein
MRADCLPGVSVSINVDQKALAEHHTENDVMAATTYIEATAGVTFTISLSLEDAYAHRRYGEHLEWRVSLDGELVRASLASPLQHSHVMEGAVETIGGASTMRKFCFSEHTSSMTLPLGIACPGTQANDRTADVKANATLVEKFKNVGEIKIELHRCQKTATGRGGDHRLEFKGVGDADIPEKALKGRSVSNHTT